MPKIIDGEQGAAIETIMDWLKPPMAKTPLASIAIGVYLTNDRDIVSAFNVFTSDLAAMFFLTPSDRYTSRKLWTSLTKRLRSLRW